MAQPGAIETSLLTLSSDVNLTQARRPSVILEAAIILTENERYQQEHTCT
jgi:hypothetical protein